MATIRKLQRQFVNNKSRLMNNVIILQDNLSTLGAEVARITQQYQTLLQQQQHQPKMK